MNYDPPHLLPFAAPVPRAFFRVSRSNALHDLPRSLSSRFYMYLSFSLYLFYVRSLSFFILVCSLHQSLAHLWKEGLRSSCRLVGNAVPGVARTLRMVTKGAPTALSLREFPDELLCYLHASEATPGASTMALVERMEQYRSVTTRLQG